MTEFPRLIINRASDRAIYPLLNEIERLFRPLKGALTPLLDAMLTGLVHSAPVMEMLEGC